MHKILSRELNTFAWIEDDEEYLYVQGELIDDRHHVLTVLKFNYQKKQVVEVIKTELIKSPYPYCSDIIDIVENVVGLRVETGSTSLINKKLGGKEGCIHLAEVVIQIFKCFYQAVHRIEDNKLNTEEERKTRKFKVLKNSCYAYNEKFINGKE